MRYLNWEGNRHRPGGAWLVLIKAASVAAALYVLWIGALAQVTGNAALILSRELPFLQPQVAAFAAWARAFTAYFHLDISIFIAITFPIAFLTTTARRGRKHLAWTDVALAALSLAVALYYIVYNDRFLHWSRGFSQPNAADLVAGFALVALVIELCRRSVGWGLTTLVVALLLITVFGRWLPGALRHDNFSVGYFIEMMTIMENGVFGAPLEVAATYAFLFVLFGSFYEKAGGGKLFFDLASAVTGRMRGGAAKACVTASGLYGSISGSPTADVATTGPLTIPIMKKMGVPAARCCRRSWARWRSSCRTSPTSRTPRSVGRRSCLRCFTTIRSTCWCTTKRCGTTSRGCPKATSCRCDARWPAAGGTCCPSAR